MASNKHWICNTGFTLIEVMVALAVAAIGIMSIVKLQSSNVDVATRLQSKTVANWIAGNRMAELRMNRYFQVSGTDTSTVKMSGLDWDVEESYFATRDPNIVRVTIRVYTENEQAPVTTQTGFLGRYKAAQL